MPGHLSTQRLAIKLHNTVARKVKDELAEIISDQLRVHWENVHQVYQLAHQMKHNTLNQTPPPSCL